MTPEPPTSAIPDTVEPASAPGRRSRGTGTWLVLGLALFLLVSGAVLAVHAIANLRFDAAIAAHRAAVAEATAVEESTAAIEADAAATAGIAASMLAAPDAFVDPAAKATLSTAAGELGAEVAAAPEFEIESADAPGPIRRPVWFVSLDRASSVLTAETERLHGGIAESEAHATALVDLDQSTAGAGLAYLAGIAPVAASIEAAHGSARNVERIEYRLAMEQLAGATWGSDASARVEQYVAAATALQSTHAAEEAEKAGPLYERRVAVEAFARSIAGGVLLEFDWAPMVIGYGDNGSAGGTATWDTWEGGLSTITLSNSIAELWDDPRMPALVVHEVGHAITSKCYDLVAEYADDNEPWATAWAIGMGYTNGDGNGEWLYGRPSDELIQRSMSCR
ncbi:hypothetical protein [Agromyces badenianii]|uniref:hypothetical protein n=1 Tax=Agromyces badenianii TaxID=2080742 RepID=UPI000D595111|nr:hypothetical protein [Agromyces badenianii]PWC03455.1 hypothetical protein DCE94_10425 [Agromyces badenianii]